MSTDERPRERSAPSLGALMVLIAAGAVGFWLVLPQLRQTSISMDELLNSAWYLSVALLGSLSLVGPPLLLWDSRRSRRRWGPGKFHWFAQGTASWLMWPPILYNRFQTPSQSVGPRDGIMQLCYFYGTPMMGLYVLIALLAGGRWRRTARRRLGPSWRERFGQVMALLWAIVGFLILCSLYYQDFRR